MCFFGIRLIRFSLLCVFKRRVLLRKTLDALDGKQARRTKTSSPLGSIFDHGCDIFTIVRQNAFVNIRAKRGYSCVLFFPYVKSFVSISTVALFRCGFGLQSVAIIVFSAHLSQFLYLVRFIARKYPRFSFSKMCLS